MKNWAKPLFLLAFPAAAGFVGYFANEPACTPEVATVASTVGDQIESDSDRMIDAIAQRAVAAATPVDTCTNELMRRAGTAVCFAPGTPPEVIEDFTRRMMMMEMEPDGEGGMAYELGSRWSGSQGSPRALTWSFMPNGVSIPGGAGEPTSANTLFTTLDSQFANNGGRSTWIAKFQACFDRWAAVTGLSYTRVTNGGNDWDDGAAWGSGGSPGNRGDVRIGMHFIDGGGGVLAWDQFPAQGGDMCIDSGDTWDSAAGDYRTLRNTVMHEHGHGIGLEHSCPGNGTKLMEPQLNTNFDGPQHDDIRGAQRHYGDLYETNDSAATAVDMGNISPGGQILNFGNITNPTVNFSSLLSIDGNGDVDWYAFTITAPLSVSITVTPRGLNYDQSSQNSNGSCNSGNNNNSIDEANLNVDLIDRNAVTVLASANSQPAGTAETIPSTSLSTTGTYYFRVVESGSPTQTQMYVVTVDASCAGPSFTDQPDSVSVCSGGVAGFTIAATGSGNSYQWRHDGVNISGANGTSYTDLNVQPADAGQYDCVVTNSCGSATSDPATLDVTETIGFTSQPQSQTVCEGEVVGFAVAVTGGAPITYQWQRNNVNISGAVGPSYTILSASPSHEGTYHCVVTNPCGSEISGNAVLNVTEEAYITSQPTNQSACIGGSVTFTVQAAGDTPTYQWRHNGNNISGATSASYTDNDVQAGDAGNYDVIVSNDCNTEISTTVTLTIGGEGPQITQQPQNAAACEGGSATFTVVVSGGAPTYQWRHNGVDISGATSNSYMLTNINAGNAGNYDCVVTSTCGSTTSDAATLSVYQLGDANCDGTVNNFDIDSFVLGLVEGEASWSSLYSCDFHCALDVNRDGNVDNFDIDPFVICVLNGGCP